MFKPALTALALVLALSAPVLAADFTLASRDIPGPDLAPAQYSDSFGCTGGNLSPELHWSDAPAGTKSFVITVYDPDAPTGSGWWHWTVANIPASVSALATGAGSGQAALPEGAVMTLTDTGHAGFTGACPPPGQKHRYVFTIKALGIARLDLPPEATPALLGFLANAAELGEARLTAEASR